MDLVHTHKHIRVKQEMYIYEAIHVYLNPDTLRLSAVHIVSVHCLKDRFDLPYTVYSMY